MTALVPPEPAGAGDTEDRAPVPAAFLPEGTPHPDPFLAARGWLVVGGIWRRANGSGGGEEQAA